MMISAVLTQSNLDQYEPSRGEDEHNLDYHLKSYLHNGGPTRKDAKMYEFGLGKQANTSPLPKQVA
jgi:hypothetical protein